MKSAAVVLALAGACTAAPEADPQVLLNAPAAFPYANPALFNPYAAHMAAPTFLNQYQYTAPVVYSAPAVQHVPYVAPVVQHVPAFAPASIVKTGPLVASTSAGNCVTAEGCAVRDLINAGLAGTRISKRSADAEADPQLLYSNYFGAAAPYAAYNTPYAAYNTPYAGAYAGAFNTPYAGAFNTPYAGAYNPYFNGANLYNNFNNLQYAAGAPVLNAGVPAVLAAQPIAAPAVAVAQPILKAVHAPALVAAQPIPVAHTLLKAAPLPLPAPVLVRQPVVATKTKKVTYTHIGKHPVNPTTVFETEQQVLY